jgi:hypothetical protein
MPEIDRHTAYRELLKTYVDAFEDLEVLLEVSRPDYQPADSGGLATRLRVPGSLVSSALDRLTAARVLQLVNGLVVLGTLDERTRVGLDELQRLAETNRLQVMADMTTHAIERLRSGALRAFTRAFILKKDSDG